MINLPSLMKKTKYQRFHVVPRHYDPVREDIKTGRHVLRPNWVLQRNLLT